MTSIEPARLIGRVATLTGLVSKPELNEQIVVIKSFDTETFRFVAQLHPDPGSASPPMSVAVKRANLKLSTGLFDEAYPHARVVYITRTTYTDNIPPGAILDYSLCPTVLHTPLFSKSCSVRGESKLKGPTTNFVDWVKVALPNDDDAIEFEDFTFNKVLCSSGKNIVFRRCFFTSAMYGAVFGGAVVKGRGTKVICENCVFDACGGNCVTVADQGQCILLSCTLRKTQSGIQVTDNGCASLICCTIQDMTEYGAELVAKGNSLTMNSCSVLRCKVGGIYASGGGSVRIEKCYTQKCGLIGIVLQGPSRCTATVSETVVTGCLVGMVVELGKTTVAIQKCELINNSVVGLRIAKDAVGEVVVTDSIIEGNVVQNINNDGGPKSALVVDGVLQQQGLRPPKGATTARHIRQVIERNFNVHECLAPIQCLDRDRARKIAGLGSVHCAACDKEEPTKEKFNVCARCTNVCYCSKECQVCSNNILVSSTFMTSVSYFLFQVGHWGEHKKVCKDRYGRLKVTHANKAKWIIVLLVFVIVMLLGALRLARCGEALHQFNAGGSADKNTSEDAVASRCSNLC